MTAHNDLLAPKGPSRQGFRKGCRCTGCVDAGQGFLAERRARQSNSYARKKERAAQGLTVITSHGISGYQRGCRCEECLLDYKDVLEERKEKAFPKPPPDWDAVEHIKPGSGVRRRTA